MLKKMQTSEAFACRHWKHYETELEHDYGEDEDREGGGKRRDGRFPPFITYHSCFTTDRRDSFSSLFFFVPTIRKIPPRPFGALYAVVVADAVEVLVAVAAVEVNR